MTIVDIYRNDGQNLFENQCTRIAGTRDDDVVFAELLRFAIWQCQLSGTRVKFRLLFNKPVETWARIAKYSGNILSMRGTHVFNATSHLTYMGRMVFVGRHKWLILFRYCCSGRGKRTTPSLPSPINIPIKPCCFL